MARFSRLRLSNLHRSTRLLLLATGCFGISAAPAWSEHGAEACNSRSNVVTTSKAVAVDAYISGFKTLLGELNTQKFDNQPLMTNGSTLAKAILKHNARHGKNILQESPKREGEKADLPFSAVAMSGMIPVTPLEQWTAEIAATEASRQLMKAASPTPLVQHTIGADGLERIGIDFDIDFAITPRIIISEEEESLLGIAAEALETIVQPLLEPSPAEPGWLASSDAAPLENPPVETNLAEYMPQFPGGDDAPTENPELETSAALVVWPTMSPDEYLAAFQDRVAAQKDSSGQILPVAHHEMIQACDSPALRALGGPIAVTPCESETCRGFTIQFAPSAPATAGAEARVFDGPAQIKLCDTSGTDSGTAEPAVNEETPREESLDEVAARLQREFLARAMSGEFDQPKACPAENCQPCPGEKSAAKTCPPCGVADCPGCPAGSPCCAPATLPTLSAPPVHARSQWTLPTPAVTYNPYAQPPVGCFPMPAPTTFAAPPQMACGPQPPRPEYPSANAPYPGVNAAAPAARLPITHESLETHREISRTLDQLAERCEAQGMYDKADQLRELARENRLSARAIHGQLATLPVPVPYTVPTPYAAPTPYPVPAGYYPEPVPMLVPPPVNPPLPQPLPIAQPIVLPRY